MLVRIVKDWQYPESFFLQTPGGSRRWGGIEFTEDPVDTCDYLIVLQRPPYDIYVRCRTGNTWIITQEPPIKYFRFYTKAFRYFDKVFTYFETDHPHRRSLQPVLPWHVLRGYDELTAIGKQDLDHKKDELVWITSNKNFLPGQKSRVVFIKYLRESNFKFHLFGTGFKKIHDKFDGLFPFKYALAVENYSLENYWTEKLADSFLSWCLPFYWGASNIEQYFPADSFIRIDITQPGKSFEIIQKAIQDREWEKRIDAIEEARNLILNHYQFFPYISGMIQRDLLHASGKEYKNYLIPRNQYPRSHMLLNQVNYYKKRILNLIFRDR